MYKVHHDAVKLPVHVESDTCSSIPAISACASEDDNGKIHVSKTNIDPKNEQTIRLELRGVTAKLSGGTAITSPNMADHNTFDDGNKVVIRDFNDAKAEGAKITVNLPPKSVVTLELA
jgi:alpha-N-arabinofuranosidase